MVPALLVGLVLGLLWFFEKLLGTPMITRPIIVSTCVGLVLGHVTEAIMIGASLELVFMGAIQIGGSIPPDVLAGAGLGTAFAILANQGPEVALALALPIAILAQSIKALIFIVRSWMMDHAVKLAQNADISKMKAWNIFGLVLQSGMYFIVAFVAILVGSEAVANFVAVIPQPVMDALTNIGKLLPAVGFALLLQPMMDKTNVIYFLLGFMLLSYMNLPIMAITLFGAVLAFIIVFEKAPKAQAVSAAKGQEESEEGWEDLFNE